MRKFIAFAGLALVLLVPQGCATARTPMAGKFDRPAVVNSAAGKVSAFFHFRHMAQQHGWDSIPKLKAQGVTDFNNLFRDALLEINNLSRYDTFTESPGDVDVPKRREELEAYKKANDYTVVMDFFEESSFAQQSFSGIISLFSLTLVPMPYTWDYTITAKVTDKDGNFMKAYERKASLNQWTQAFLLFVYPFYPYEGKREELYSEAMHDIFRQIETEKILKSQ